MIDRWIGIEHTLQTIITQDIVSMHPWSIIIYVSGRFLEDSLNAKESYWHWIENMREKRKDWDDSYNAIIYIEKYVTVFNRTWVYIRKGGMRSDDDEFFC